MISDYRFVFEIMMDVDAETRLIKHDFSVLLNNSEADFSEDPVCLELVKYMNDYIDFDNVFKQVLFDDPITLFNKDYIINIDSYELFRKKRENTLFLKITCNLIEVRNDC